MVRKMAYKANWKATSQEEVEAGTDVSKINAAQLINFRIQDAWNACRKLWKEGRFDELRDELNSLWTDFYADAKKEHIEMIKTLDEEILIALKKRNLSRGNMSKWNYFNNNYKKAVFTKWLFLKQVEKEQGVGKAYVDKEADDWD